MNYEKARALLLQEGLDDCGWLSDLHHRGLTYDEDNDFVWVGGTGSIDIGHLLALIEIIVKNEKEES